MARIGTIGRLGTGWGRPAQTERAAPEPASSEGEAPPVRALVVLEGGRSDARRMAASADRFGTGRPSAGFVAQLLIAQDPTLRPSRQERTRIAAALYAETARRLA